MANLQDIALSAYVNILSVLSFLLAYAFLRLLPFNKKVYFSKWYAKAKKGGPEVLEALNKNVVNVSWKSRLMFWTWMEPALKMPDAELIEHAGLDSCAYIRIYLLGLKIFIPIAILALVVLMPVNWTGATLSSITKLTYSNVDKLSLSNIPAGSFRLCIHVIMAYVVTFRTCYVLYKEYEVITMLRLNFLASEKRRPDQFTVLVRNIPPDPDESVSEHVEHFFSENHPDHYLTHQVVYDAKKLAKLVKELHDWKKWLSYYEKKFKKNPNKRPVTKTGWMGLYGSPVDAIDYHKAVIQRLSLEEKAEREKIATCDPRAILPVAFVSFKSRWGAAVCAQTQQSYNPMIWLTERAPEPRDVFWNNLAIPTSRLAGKKLLASISMFFLTFFFMIPIAFVQSLASLDGIQTVLVFVRPWIQQKSVKSFIQGVLPGFILKLFMLVLPSILTALSKFEGHISLSLIDKKTAGKYHFFGLVNVFFGSIIAGTAFQQLDKILHQTPQQIPKTLGVGIPMKATFFITYIMVDGWASVASEIVRLMPLIKFYVLNTLLALTELEVEEATEPDCLNFSKNEPRIQLYFLLGLVYSAVSPLILPFIVAFFAFAFVIYRHQIINVYEQKYESGAAFWPHVHRGVIKSLILSQLLLMGMLSAKKAVISTPLLLALTFFTLWFNSVCKRRFESAFRVFPIQDAMIRDMKERANEPDLNLKDYLKDAYVHPVLKGMEMDRPAAVDEEENKPLVAPATDRTFRHKKDVATNTSFQASAIEEFFSHL